MRGSRGYVGGTTSWLAPAGGPSVGFQVAPPSRLCISTGQLHVLPLPTARTTGRPSAGVAAAVMVTSSGVSAAAPPSVIATGAEADGATSVTDVRGATMRATVARAGVEVARGTLTGECCSIVTGTDATAAGAGALDQSAEHARSGMRIVAASECETRASA